MLWMLLLLITSIIHWAIPFNIECPMLQNFWIWQKFGALEMCKWEKWYPKGIIYLIDVLQGIGIISTNCTQEDCTKNYNTLGGLWTSRPLIRGGGEMVTDVILNELFHSIYTPLGGPFTIPLGQKIFQLSDAIFGSHLLGYVIKLYWISSPPPWIPIFPIFLKFFELTPWKI